MTQELSTGNRMVSVITSRGEAKKIAVAAAITSWKQLQVILTQAGYVLSGMKVVESIGKTTLEHPEAKLPEINFRLYIMPMESKSGARATKVATPEKPKKATKAAKEKPAKASKVVKRAKKVVEEVEEERGIDVEIDEPLESEPAPVEVEEYEPTPEELAQEWRNISEGIPGVKKR